MNVQVEPPEKKKTTTKNSSPPSPTPSFSLLPDEISLNCLARISRAYYPTLSVVSKSLRSLLSSTELYAARSHLGSTEQCLYVCLLDRSYQFHPWFTLWINPNRTLHNSMINKKKKKTIGHLLVSIPSSHSTSVSYSIAVGSEIYIIGGPVDRAPSSAVRVLDCRSHTWCDAPRMNVARKHAHTCVYDGKIYVMGGCVRLEDKLWAEVFDTKTQTWESLPDPGTEIRNCTVKRIVEIEGKIHFGYANFMYAYDPKQGKWECSKGLIATFPVSDCVVESVSYRYGRCEYQHGRYGCWWYDINGGFWKEVKGLNSLREKYERNGGSSSIWAEVVSCGGKLLVLWKGYMRNPNHKKKIWCAEIALEKRHEGEIWGNLEWVDAVHTVPASCSLLHCLAVSV